MSVLVIANYGMRVDERPDGGCVIRVSPMDDETGETDHNDIGIMVKPENREAVSNAIRGSSVKPASVSDLRGIVGSGQKT